ncbi:MAG: hypothetical protein AB1753_06905 [Thermoproteota archaeon]
MTRTNTVKPTQKVKRLFEEATTFSLATTFSSILTDGNISPETEARMQKRYEKLVKLAEQAVEEQPVPFLKSLLALLKSARTFKVEE